MVTVELDRNKPKIGEWIDHLTSLSEFFGVLVPCLQVWLEVFLGLTVFLKDIAI